MKISIEINRSKANDKIYERFSIYPKWNKTFDHQKALYYVVWQLTHDLGIGKDYRLIERKELTDSIINVYEYETNKNVPKLNDRFEFVYLPFQGEKKCSNCIHMRTLKDNKNYCKLRGKKIKNNHWYKCEFMQEIFRGHNV